MFNEFHYQVRGRGHQAEGTRGQDRTAYVRRADLQVLCLADGAGSATHSEYGAQSVVRDGCDLLIERFHDFAAGDDAAQARRDIVEHLRRGLTETAVKIGCEVADLASTFMAVAVSRDQFLIAHVGDGVVGYVKNGEMKVASNPDNAEFANATTFVTSSEAVASLRLFRGSLEGVSGFIIMSDGTGASLYDQRSRELAPACEKLIAITANAPTRYSKNPEYKRRLKRAMNTQIRPATKDDCSIGIFGRRIP